MSSKDWIQIQMSRHARQAPPKPAVSVHKAGALPVQKLPGNPLGRDLPARQEVFDNCYWKRWRPPRQKVCNAFPLFMQG